MLGGGDGAARSAVLTAAPGNRPSASPHRASSIDLDIISELTEYDLENLGISLGNRRQLMNAIARRGRRIHGNPHAVSLILGKILPGPGTLYRAQTLCLYDRAGEQA
jgi:hypothetical protein